MLGARTSPSLESSEEARAFLQSRVGLFWKVLFFMMLFACGLAVFGALKRPGADLFVDLGLTAEAGVFWWLCRGKQRSTRFLRVLEGAGLFVYFAGASLLGRFVLIGFASERALATTEGALMADAYLSVLGLVGSALMILVRAALIPSSPRRTLLYTSMVGLPVILTPTLLVPNTSGHFSLRAFESSAYPWYPSALTMVWVLVVATSVVISRVIYGLRAEVRHARRLGQYVIEEKIGEGGMGEVYRARHAMMRRPSAIKLLRAERAEERDLARFEREVQLTARLTHPNTITIFDYGRTDDGVFYYTMELLDGANLQRVVEVSGPQPEGRVLRILNMACGALSEAHALGIIHRDIKPANIMLCTQGGEHDVVKLLDFGLVKELSVEGAAGVSVASTLVGTPHYMSPEAIIAPDSVDARADIYALGAVAYFLLAGREVFDGKTLVEVCSQHLHQEPRPLSEHGVAVSAELERLVRACLAKNAEARPASVAELRRGLEECSLGGWDSEHARRWWSEHRRALDRPAANDSIPEMTIAIDGRSR